MTISIIIDVVVITLLIATIAYAVLLNKRLTTLHKGRDELQKFLDTFSLSMAKAEGSVKDLKAAGEAALHAVVDQLTKATALRDELAFLTEKSDALAAALDERINESRTLLRQLEETQQLPRKSLKDVSLTADHSAQAEEEEPDIIRTLKRVR
ncbi:MAG: DUF6468 domain-containing protein [Holosporales bacterium]